MSRAREEEEERSKGSTYPSKVLCSSKILILLNGGPVGYFNIERGLRQEDPMSPILSILMEEVLCRGMQALIQDGKIKPFQGPRDVDSGNHLEYMAEESTLYGGDV
ncbi:uncharacterized mitochondrial protein AtMg01250-like [Macadamia integrifolia]|uniref:uncharacterized mitochondrial protein AtMg01250-like n=1 Tax=Macadamia integrifolia TaxID=60698 RepID=UPI001C52919C|nr:uncharacterized mitochondrial protein AtMg01250-like [Macadamia integrifolia]